MKKFLSLLLAVMMVVAVVPVLGLTAVAAAPTTSYVVYEQDFDSIDTAATGTALLGELGWYVPLSKADTNIATYSIVEKGTNKVLRVNTVDNGGDTESFVSIFGGEVMSILRETDFTLSYRLTYRPETTNNDGYASVIYNYNEMHGSVANGNGNEVYGIAAVRMCGTGLNAVYYPAQGSACAFHTLERQVGSPNVMENRYEAECDQPSLYARLFNAAEAENEVRTGTSVMANRILDITVSYSYENGVFIEINGIRVSDMNYTLDFNTFIRNEVLWNDFVTRNTGATVALLTQPGVVADIDNISISTTNINTVDDSQELPALVITEVSGTPTETWTEFIEIYNPNDFAVDVANYSLVYSSTSYDAGNAINSIADSRKSKYTNYVNLANVFGKEQVSPNTYYMSVQNLEKFGANCYKLVDDKFYTANSDGTYSESADGSYRLVNYVDNWNTRYVRGSADYATNTMLNPGDCMIVRMSEGWDKAPTNGMTNFGNLTTDFASKGFRQLYKKYGLSAETKVVAQTVFNVADADDVTYYVGKATDENGKEINYKNLYISNKEHIESYVHYCSATAIGIRTEADSMIDSTNIGKGGFWQNDYSGSYVYGVDGSMDYRCGTLYDGLTPINHTSRSHVGKLAGYQEIVIGNFYKRAETAPGLMITEIMPKTNNLEGQALNAFAAMELTNTSDKDVNVYDYALVRTQTGVKGKATNGFMHSVELRAGNPVNRGDGNGAYYFFAEDYISNPETCTLAPGESVVLWFLNADTYTSYYTDADFGFDYFRQYWVNNGSPELAIKDAAGEYAVKVIAVDGCDSATYNAPNATRVFSLTKGDACVYGVANATANVIAGTPEITDVTSIAYFGAASIYFKLTKTKLAAADGSEKMYYANVLKYAEVPVNTGMRYLAGSTYSNRVSSMVDSLKILRYSRVSSLPNYTVEITETAPDPALELEVETSCANQAPGLGVLEGTELDAIKNTLFVGKADEAGNIAYHYFNESRNAVFTLTGAALPITNGAAATLRFDNAVRRDIYTSLVGTYGAANVKVGMLIFDSSATADDITLTRDGLSAAGIQFQDVEGVMQYYTDDYAVLGSTISVAAGSYGTDYTAVGYMEVTTADGKTHIYWSNSSTERSVAAVAEAALEDLQSTESEAYKYKIGVKYSRYSIDERKVLQGFAG